MGTHPIFESDFDCLTEVVVIIIMVVQFSDVAKAPKDLFKKPFNAGKIDVDIKSGAFTLKNSVKGSALSSNLEFKGADAFMGMGKGMCLPYTKKYDGKVIKFEVAKQFSLRRQQTRRRPPHHHYTSIWSTQQSVEDEIHRCANCGRRRCAGERPLCRHLPRHHRRRPGHHDGRVWQRVEHCRL